MKLKQRISALFMLAVVLLFNVNMTASAHDVPDLTRAGSISVTVKYDGKAVSGGTLSVCRVGNITENNGDYSFTLVSDFVDSRVSLADPGSDRAAAELASFAEGRKMSMQTGEISEDGTIVFQNLEPGLYLLVQKDAADGYNEINPFLVSVPMLEGGEYIYEIDASPKVETEKTNIPPEKPEQSPQTGHSDDVLPHIIAVEISLCMAGAIGCALFLHRRKKK